MVNGSFDAINDALNNIEIKPVETQPINEIKIGVMNYMENKRGVDNIVTALTFLEKVGNVLHDFKNSGANLLNEIAGFIPLSLSLPGFITSLSEVPFEAADQITPDEQKKIEDVILKSDYIQDLIAKGTDKQTAIDDHITEIINLKNFLFKYYININIPAPPIV
jgi:hypothetical protein